MNENFLKDFFNTIIFLIPILGLVWKGAKISARVDEIENRVAENIEKFCRDHKEMQSELDEEKEYRLTDTQELKDILNKIQQSIVRLETKIELSEK
jgi:hypothetical protein